METSKSRYNFIILILVLFSIFLSCQSPPADQTKESKLSFQISFPAETHSDPITGRVFVMIANNDEREPRLQAGSWRNSTPFFAVDVEELSPGESVTIDENILGFPPNSLKDIPQGDYYIQALVNIYTEFKRSDGHTIWAHMDQWEGQHFNRSPGNLISAVQKVPLDPSKGYSIELQTDQVIPPIEVPEDTKWVKRIKIKSELLSEFWGHPIYLGAVVLLPKDYDNKSDVNYPVIYYQGHFSLNPPFRFEEGNNFYNVWNSENCPRMIAITFQHPCPYFDDSYAVNSDNCGPFGDAILNELIPEIENQFRIIQKPYARILTGGSTGGWESFALQLFHPDFFGGAFIYAPDPVDFNHYILTNIYEDKNALTKQFNWMNWERPFMRDVDGQVMVTMRELSQLEAVLGTKGRSGEQLDIWQAVYGPVGDDGYPKLLWDKSTGEIDHNVAEYMKQYDLLDYTKKNWSKIGPKLVGKLHFLCGDMDNYYLNEATLEMEGFLEGTTNPYYAGSFRFGRPRQGHGWGRADKDSEARIKEMAEFITKNAPSSEDVNLWIY